MTESLALTFTIFATIGLAGLDGVCPVRPVWARRVHERALGITGL